MSCGCYEAFKLLKRHSAVKLQKRKKQFQSEKKDIFSYCVLMQTPFSGGTKSLFTCGVFFSQNENRPIIEINLENKIA